MAPLRTLEWMARLQMLGVAAASALAGFLTTFTLLHLNAGAMWLRYGASVIAAYGVFLLLVVRCGRYYRENPRLAAPLRGLLREPSPTGERESRRGSWGVQEVLGDLIECSFDDLGVVLLLLLAGLGIAYVAAWLTPEWIAILDWKASSAWR